MSPNRRISPPEGLEGNELNCMVVTVCTFLCAGCHNHAIPGGLPVLMPYQLKASAWLRYPNSSVLSNHRSTSYLASSRLPEACTRLATALPVAMATVLVWFTKSPRIDPGWASFGYVEPTILRTVATASSPSTTNAMTGPRCMNSAVAL